MAKQKRQIAPAGDCKDFEMDLTDYVTGDTTFLTKDRQAKLFEHLRTCADCRAQLWNWKEVLAVLKGKAESQKPEYKEKMDKLIRALQADSAKLPCQMIKGAEVVPGKVAVGRPSGIVWRCVAEHGIVNLDNLPELTNLNPKQAYGGYGWLVLQEKIIVLKDKQKEYICLTETERRQYRPQA